MDALERRKAWIRFAAGAIAGMLAQEDDPEDWPGAAAEAATVADHLLEELEARIAGEWAEGEEV